MSKVDGGELLVRMLERAGIREFFTLHGGHLDSILMASRRHGFRMIDTRHEQAAVQAADGWARTTGKPGVAIVTAGPGVADAVARARPSGIDDPEHRPVRADFEHDRFEVAFGRDVGQAHLKRAPVAVDVGQDQETERVPRGDPRPHPVRVERRR